MREISDREAKGRERERGEIGTDSSNKTLRILLKIFGKHERRTADVSNLIKCTRFCNKLFIFCKEKECSRGTTFCQSLLNGFHEGTAAR
jgi:hypothetical protein